MHFATEFGYVDKKPVIRLKARVPRAGNAATRYLIPLDHVWLYSEDHYEQVTPEMPSTYESYMLHKSMDLFQLFDFNIPDSRQLAELAWLIQDSIEQLLKMPPELPERTREESQEPNIVAKLSINGDDPNEFALRN